MRKWIVGVLAYATMYAVAIFASLVSFWFVVRFGTRAVLDVLRAEGVIP